MRAHDLEDGIDVDAGGVPRQIPLELRHAQPKVLAQHLQQGRVDPHLVVVQLQPEARAHAGAFQRDRHQQQRGAVSGLALLPGPREEADREVEDVGPTLLEAVAGQAKEIEQAAVELGLGRGGVDLPPGERRLEIAAPTVVVMPAGVEVGAALVGPAQYVRDRLQAELLPGREAVLQGPGRDTFEHDRALAGLEVQELVAERQVEELALPALHPADWSLWGLIGRRSRFLIEAGRCGERLVERCRRCRREVCRPALTEIHRADAAPPAAPNIDCDFEWGGRVVLDLGATLRDRDLERRRRVVGQQCRLDEDEVLQVPALAQELHVIDGRTGEILVLQPQTDEGVALRQHQDRVQARLLQAGGVEKREIEAGADLAIQDLARTAHLLAGLLEARRR